MAEIDVECEACKATGIYRGLAEPKGVGVVCLKCGGWGRKTLTYKPFGSRKRRDDIQTVQLSRGSLFATGVGPGGESITYAEFLAGGMPTAAKGGTP